VERGYGEDYGSSCLNWDADKSWCTDLEPPKPEWCEPEYTWCYVDPACEDSLETVYFIDTEYEGLLNWRECEGLHDCILEEQN
jgi:hypothetical protein